MTNIVHYNSDDRISNASSDGHLIRLWLRSKSPNSKDAYARDIRQFLDFSGLELSSVKLETIWEWLDELQERNLTVSTRARKLASLKSLFSFANKIGYLSFNVGAAVSLPNIPDLLAQRILTEQDLHLILDTANSQRNSVLLKLFYATGARVSELSVLRWEHVRQNNRPGKDRESIITLVGKGSKSRNVIVPVSMSSVLKQLNEAEQTDGYGTALDPVFRSAKGGFLSRQQMWRIVKKAAATSGVRGGVSPHWLRHAHASHSLDRGAPTHLVQETLGHKSLSTTSRYTHARPDDSSGKYLDV